MAAAALGYASIPADLGLEGPEADARLSAIEDVCEELELRLVEVVRERRDENGDAAPQPGLLRALERIDAGEASCLVVRELEDLGRRVRPLATVLDRLERGEARLVALDVGLDTASEAGRLAVARTKRVGKSEAEPAPGAPAAEAPPEPALPARPLGSFTGLEQQRLSEQFAAAPYEEGVPTKRRDAKWRRSSVQSAAGWDRKRTVGDLPSVKDPN